MMKQASTTTLLRPRISKSCDQCKARKVRCVCLPDSQSCKNCLKRNAQCHFSQTKRKLRYSGPNSSPGQGDAPCTPAAFPSPATDVSSELPGAWHRNHRKLYLDHLLENPRVGGRQRQVDSLFKAHEHYVASSNLAFFSESRIRSLSERLGHNRLREIVERIDAFINSRLNPSDRPSNWTIQFRGPSSPIQLSKDAVSSYIEAYFDRIHPTYPILDRSDFEKKAFSADLPRYLKTSPPYSALYHAVLALGCQYTEGGSFDPGNGKAWKLFQVSLGLFLDIIVPRETLVKVQAMTAMAIFAVNLSCMGIGETLISEAARMAQSLGYHKALYAGENEAACQRTFWVIYSMEKTATFFIGRGSAFLDSDIGCPIPEMPDQDLRGFDWFLSSARFSRLISKTYEMLFSVTATMNSTDQYHAAIDEINDDLENWRKAFPKDIRPGEPFRAQLFPRSSSMLMTLKWHYFYYGVTMSLCRLTLHIGAETPFQRLEEAKIRLMNTARVVIDLTRFIDAEPYTSIWMLGIIPLSALFILFDFVVHNPFHPETGTNLALLSVAAGYFSRLEYATGGSVPSGMVSDFADIARQFVRDARSGSSTAAVTDAVVGTHDNNNNNNNTGSLNQGHQNAPAEASQNVGYLSGHVARNPHKPDPSQMNLTSNNNSNIINNNNINNNNGIHFTGNLLYPVTEFPAPMSGELLGGFDISNLFDVVIPEFTSPM